MKTARSNLGVALVVALLAVNGQAFAQDRQAESAARDALKKAQLDAMTQSFDAALTRLRTAQSGCTATRCSLAVRAALARDIGVMLRHTGDEGASARSFVEALTLEPKIELPSEYDGAEMHAAWQLAREQAAAASAGQPDGDFVHTPVAEQRVGAAVPIYVEYAGAIKVTAVTVKYRGEGQRELKTLPLVRRGAGWAGFVPCTDVTAGVLRYFLQGFEEHGSPVALAGSPKHPFTVPVRATLRGAAPTLPGEGTPPPCSADATAGLAAAPSTGDARECSDDAACGSGTCQAGRCTQGAADDRRGPTLRRVWVGISGSVELTTFPSGSDVCKLDGSAQATSGLYCTTPAGADFPSRSSRAENDALVAGKAGAITGGPLAGNVRALASLDIAVTSNTLVGVRLGYVANAYSGDAARNEGRAFKLPLHLELRYTRAFGDDALIRTGFAPVVSLGAGAAPFDASRIAQATQSGIPGRTPVTVWRTGGPWFAGVGGGARYAFSPTAAFTAQVILRGALGGSSFVPTAAPELAIQYGF